MRGSRSTLAALAVGVGCLSFACRLALATDVAWNNPSGGSFQDGTNWAGGMPPGTSDTALFDLSSVPPYTVTFAADAQTNRLTINGTAQFDLSSHQYTVTGPSSPTFNPGVTVNGSLSIQHGTMLVQLDNAVNGTLRLSGPDVQWNGSLIVEGGGELDVTAGALLNTSNAGFTSGGTINLNGPGSTWTNSIFDVVGSQGPTGIPGSLNITDGAVLQSSGIGTIGLGSATVSGASGSSRSSLFARSLTVNGSTSSLTITNGALVSAGALDVGTTMGNTGVLTVGQASGGFAAELDLSGGMDIADNQIGAIPGTYTGTFILNSGGKVTTPSITVGAGPANPNAIVGSGEIDLNGGVLIAGRLIGQQGSINLSAGLLNATTSETLNYGVVFNQTGGTHLVWTPANGSSGPMLQTLTIAVSTGSWHTTYNLSGGSLQANLVNNDRFNYTGGSIAGSVTNYGNGVISVNSGGAPLTIAGSVSNLNGIFQVTNSDLSVTDTFTNSWTLTAVSSTVHLSSLMVEPGGYLAGAQSTFLLSGNLTGSTAQNTNWDTTSAKLGVIGSAGASHILSVTGADLGRNYLGYVNNFAWGTFEIGSGQTLVLADGNTTPGGGLYVGALTLDDGLSQLGSIFSNGLTIYYDPALPANAYLEDRTYTTADGGFVEPVPEPSSLAIIAFAFIALARKRDRGSVSDARG